MIKPTGSGGVKPKGSGAITPTSTGVDISVRAVPRASRSALAGVRDGALVIKLAAPPVDGAANLALVAFLSDVLLIARRNITIVAGERGRLKRVRVTGLDHARAVALIGTEA